MPEFHDYSFFVKLAYFSGGTILIIFALFSFLQLKNNAKKIKKVQSTKKTKN
ncbi:MAG: hypothetical protein ACJA0S_001103 [Rickettsiales bacterium]|jgi:hypothetical protein